MCDCVCVCVTYLSHLRAGGYMDGAEACWLATMAEEERPAKEKQSSA